MEIKIFIKNYMVFGGGIREYKDVRNIEIQEVKTTCII